MNLTTISKSVLMIVLTASLSAQLFCNRLFGSEEQFYLDFSFNKPHFSHSLCILPGNRSLQISLGCKTSWRPSSDFEEFLLRNTLRKKVEDLISRYRRSYGYKTYRLGSSIVSLVKINLERMSKGKIIPHSFQIQLQWEELASNGEGLQKALSKGSDFYLVAVFVE